MKQASMECYAIPLLIFSSIYFFISSHAVDTITATQFLTVNSTIVSSGESYEMGFFNPPDSSTWYVGIWFKRISTGLIVWVANRDTPLTDSSGTLSLINPGVLVLRNKNNQAVWSTNTSTSAPNPVLQLLDSGNLVVRDANDDNPADYLWQSFDYLSDTLLPGMKLGKNLTTGREWSLTSMRSIKDPGRGDYTYRLDLHGFPQLFVSNGSVDVFRAGSWNGLRFTGTPGLQQNPFYTYGMFFETQAVYYRFDLIDTSIFTRFILNPSGVAQRWTWIDRTHGWVLYLNAPTDNCDGYNLCGAYGSCNFFSSPVCSCLDKFAPKFPDNWNTTDWSGGCVRRTALDCKTDGFVMYSGIKLPDTRSCWYDWNMTLKECAEVCLKNCSCTAYATLDIRWGGSGCLLWFDDLADIRVFSANGQDIYIRLAASEIVRQGGGTKKRTIIIVTLTVFSGMLLLAMCIMLYVWKRRMSYLKSEAEGILVQDSEPAGYAKKNPNEDIELPLFDFNTVSYCTNHFSSNNKLGEGGFGPVYKGRLEGQEIAVKRLSTDSRQGVDEFKNEVSCIAKLQHRNLVKLLGCCIQGEEKMLIYEFMPNKSLDAFIFDDSRRKLLDWPMRFDIINGIARGLLYLHRDSRLRIIHRDLKASNILLDIDMNPKISDFGMARIFGGNETEGNTKRVVGTYGYMSPEYAVDGLFSVKSDVFSFGVLVIEIVSGKRNRGFYHPDHRLNLLGHAWRLHKEGRAMDLIDEAASDSCCQFEVLRSIHVGLLCVQQNPEDRPTMSSVVLMLGSDGALPEPKQPGFYTDRNLDEADNSSSSRNAPSSINYYTTTVMEPR